MKNFGFVMLNDGSCFKDLQVVLDRASLEGYDDIVAVGVGLLLVVMLLFFLLAFYVNPLYRMLDGLNAYRSQDKKYTVKFDGDDQLSQLNDGITELANENRQFRSRIKTLGKK